MGIEWCADRRREPVWTTLRRRTGASKPTTRIRDKKDRMSRSKNRERCELSQGRYRRPHMARGQSGSLRLLCTTLSFATPCRFIPALSSPKGLAPPCCLQWLNLTARRTEFEENEKSPAVLNSQAISLHYRQPATRASLEVPPGRRFDPPECSHSPHARPRPRRLAHPVSECPALP